MFTSPAHIHKRLVVLAIGDAAASLGCEGIERVSYNLGHEWVEPEEGERRTCVSCSGAEYPFRVWVVPTILCFNMLICSL